MPGYEIVRDIVSVLIAIAALIYVIRMNVRHGRKLAGKKAGDVPGDDYWLCLVKNGDEVNELKLTNTQAMIYIGLCEKTAVQMRHRYPDAGKGWKSAPLKGVEGGKGESKDQGGKGS